MFADYISPEMVIFLDAETKEEAFSSLIGLAKSRFPEMDEKEILDRLMERENLLSTRVADDIAIPHLKYGEAGRTVIAVGVSKKGIPYDSWKEGLVRLIVLIIGDEKTHLETLSSLATRLSVPGVSRGIIQADSPEKIFKILIGKQGEEGETEAPTERLSVTKSCVDVARRLIEEVHARAILVHGDSEEIQELLSGFPQRIPIYLVSYSDTPERFSANPRYSFINIPVHGRSRHTQVELSLLFALSEGRLKKGDRVVSIVGSPGSDVLDSVMVTDIEREFGRFFSFQDEQLPSDLGRQILARALELANEIADEGREGKPTGTIFVLGDYENVKEYCRQMIINPFQGYSEEDRNLLDPALAETIKEFSKIDGAFIIRGDGVIMSAGTYVKARAHHVSLPSGLGSRHAAAASITAVTQAVAIAVSESTRKVSLFKNGERFLEL
ncbi:MAG TPA: diadenylate cyclase [Spirochaetia bacterium]|nr:diadenylate cyclase [Spirochaetia bacterium]